MLAPFEHALEALHHKGTAEQKDQWMGQVRTSLDALVVSYQQLTDSNRIAIDYTSIETQAAYIYAYAMPRAYFTREMLVRHRQAIGAPLFPKGLLQIVSFGGGPASELVGLLDYLKDPAHGEAVNSIEYRVFDKDADWKPVAEQVSSALGHEIQVSITYEHLDLADEVKCGSLSIAEADLIIFSYIMSELCALPVADQVAANLRSMLEPMKFGSAMLFVDSKHPQFIQYFQKCRKFIGSQKNDNGDGVALDTPAFLPTFQMFNDSLNRDPRMDGMVISKWLVKG